MPPAGWTVGCHCWLCPAVSSSSPVAERVLPATRTTRLCRVRLRDACSTSEFPPSRISRAPARCVRQSLRISASTPASSPVPSPEHRQSRPRLRRNLLLRRPAASARAPVRYHANDLPCERCQALRVVRPIVVVRDMPMVCPGALAGMPARQLLDLSSSHSRPQATGCSMAGTVKGGSS